MSVLRCCICEQQHRNGSVATTPRTADLNATDSVVEVLLSRGHKTDGERQPLDEVRPQNLVDFKDKEDKSPRSASKLFRAIDTNKDGVVDIHEFKLAYESGTVQAPKTAAPEPLAPEEPVRYRGTVLRGRSSSWNNMRVADVRKIAERKNNLMDAVRRFQDQANHMGISVNSVDARTAEEIAYIFSLNSDLCEMSLVPNDNSLKDTSHHIMLLDVERFSRLDDDELNREHPSGGDASHCIVMDFLDRSTNETRHIFFIFPNVDERNSFYMCFKVLILSTSMQEDPY